MCSSATRSNRSHTVYSSFTPSPLSLPLTWQGSLPSPVLASESKQPLMSQSNSGEATTNRRGQMNLHCKSTALQTGTRSPGGKACDEWRCRCGHTCTHSVPSRRDLLLRAPLQSALFRALPQGNFLKCFL